MPFTVTQPLVRVPTFPELQALAGQHDVQIHVRVKGVQPHAAGCEIGKLAGDFQHPQVTGNYTFEPNGDIHGDFASYVMGQLTGTFMLTTGKAEVTVNERPFLLPEAMLKSKLSATLKDFCAKYSPEAPTNE